MLNCAWWSCCSSHKDSPLWSSQLLCGRTVHVELSSSIATQLPPSILVPSWSENWTVHQSVSLARSWLFVTVRAGKYNSSTHHYHTVTVTVYRWSPCYSGLKHRGTRQCCRWRTLKDYISRSLSYHSTLNRHATNRFTLNPAVWLSKLSFTFWLQWILWLAG